MGHQVNIPALDRQHRRRFTVYTSILSALLLLGLGSFMVREVAGRENSRATFTDEALPMLIQDGEVHGAKWNDLDGNGFWGPLEPALPGWRITISGSDRFSATTVTDENGLYSFRGLQAGDYVVAEQLVAGWIQIWPPSNQYDLTLNTADIVEGVNFGNREPPLGGIQGTKWLDLNGDGIRDVEEPGLTEWTIVLTGTNNIFSSSVTNASGVYSFTNLPAGTYTVSEMILPSWEQTFPGLPGSHVIALDPGQISQAVDFGNWQPPPAEIHGKYWYDLNGNGRLDPGEPGLINWDITLEGSGTITTTSTDPNGDYGFVDIAAGTYTVTAELAGFWNYTFPTSGSYSVNVSPGDVVNGVDFGSWTTSDVYGQKWHDLNGDGIKDPGELGLGGWEIIIEGVLLYSGVGEYYTRTTTTDDNGDYSFLDVPLAVYTATEVLQPGWTQTYPQVPWKLSILSGGTSFNAIDFGNWQPGEVHGAKWHDLDGDGTRDIDEPGLQEWQINITGAGGITGTTQTDVDGNYWFLGLAADTYTVTENLQAGWDQTWPPAGYYSFLLDPKQSINGLNFGNRPEPVGGIHGAKWLDENGNGQRDPNEPGLPGWTIYLNGDGGLSLSTVTDEFGRYWFMDMPVGIYTVTENLPDVWEQTWPPAGHYSFLHEPPQSIEGLDFGNRLIRDGTIIGIVDLQGRTDDSLVEVCASINGEAGTCTTTASSGAYTLTVPAGIYDFTVEKALYIDGLKTGVTVTTTITTRLPGIMLLGGDTNEDDTVNILDLSFIGARFGYSCGDPLYDQKGDVNNDCQINILDLTLTASNFLMSSPVPWP